MKRTNIMIKARMNEYAPETFTCSVNGKYFPLEYPSTIGQIWLSKGTEAMKAEIKKEVRKRRQERRRVTIGFYVDDTKRFCYTRDLGAYNDDLQDKLRIYKLWKEFCLKNNCVLSHHEITSGYITPDGNSKTKTEEVKDKVNLKRPIKLFYPRHYEVM